MKFVSLTVCAIIAAFATLALAQNVTTPIEQFAGVYKIRKPNGIYNGVDKKGEQIIDKFVSEDVLEIIPYQPDSLYFRKETLFFNGHPCGINGIAKQTQPNTYLFDDYEADSQLRCKLQISISDSKIEFKDVTPRDDSFKWQSACQSYCGARGNIEDSWPRNKRRDIRYLPRLKNSVEYTSSIESYENQIPLGKAFNAQWDKAHPQ